MGTSTHDEEAALRALPCVARAAPAHDLLRDDFLAH